MILAFVSINIFEVSLFQFHLQEDSSQVFQNSKALAKLIPQRQLR